MFKILIPLLLFLSFFSHAKSNCFLENSERERLINLSYEKFDQDLNGGWRSVDNRGCHKEAVELIEVYLNKHKDNLLEWQIDILIWHTGQLYAFIGNYGEAVIRFRENINPNEPADDSFKWNAYVRGSIAFLEKNLDALLASISSLEKATDPHSLNNLKILKSFQRCFDKPYSEAYNPSCGI